MLTLILNPEIRTQLSESLRKAGHREIGGILMAEHVGLNEFEIKDITIHRLGTIASFVRNLEEALGRLWKFFDRNNHNYVRYNYIGEWHSHPLFEPEPSPRDDTSMKEIVRDPKVGANFVILLIAKLDYSGMLVTTAHAYLPTGEKYRATVRDAGCNNG